MQRNEPCWCGSGKKYKKCHWLREDQDPVPISQALGQFRQAFERPRCLVPDDHPIVCGGAFVRAHTVPKRAQLGQIAEAGHVYGPDMEWSTLNRTGGELAVGPVGINKASTFGGFCGAHDHALFVRIDTVEIIPDPEQCFLLTYRPLCRELYLKEAMVETLRFSRELDKGKSLPAQIDTQRTAFLMGLGASSGLMNLQRHKEIFDQQLLSSDYSHMRALVVDLDRVPDLMCTSGVSPDRDFHGRDIQDLGDLTLDFDYVGFSLLASDQGTGVAVLSWHESSDRSALPLVESFLAVPNDGKADALLRFAIEHSENVFIRPSWWDGLDDQERGALTERMRAGLPFSGRAESSLTDDGQRLAPWKVTGVRGINLDGLIEGLA